MPAKRNSQTKARGKKTSIKGSKEELAAKVVPPTDEVTVVDGAPNDNLENDEGNSEIMADSRKRDSTPDAKVEIKLEPITELYPQMISDWQGVCVEGVPHGFGRLQFRSGASYVGECYHGLMHGKGELRLPTRWTYIGDFFKNNMQGYGKIEFPDGSEYEGEVIAGYRHGIGRFQKGETCYSGMWKAGKRNGRGTCRWSNHSYYEGNWKDGKCNGYGVRQWSNGDIYTGEWSMGSRHGRGIMKWAGPENEREMGVDDGITQKYDGEWLNGLQHGHGLAIWYGAKTTIYDGEWKEGRRNGIGTIEYSNGAKYTGVWVDDAKHGQGQMMSSTGAKSLCTFNDNRLISNDTDGKDQTSSSPAAVLSMTEEELSETLGSELGDGKMGILRNLTPLRALYGRYIALSSDNVFRILHFDRFALDHGLTQFHPVVQLYPNRKLLPMRDPLSPILFRQFCLLIVSAAATIFANAPIDEAVQSLFTFLGNSKQEIAKGTILTGEYSRLIPQLHLIWIDEFGGNSTARKFLLFIKQLELPFQMKSCVSVLAKFDEKIRADIERPISFVQFCDAILLLIINYKEGCINKNASEETVKQDSAIGVVDEVTPSNTTQGSKDQKERGQGAVQSAATICTDCTTLQSGSLLRTISEMSETQRLLTGNVNSSSSKDDMSNDTSEIYQYFQEQFIGSWNVWVRVKEEIFRNESLSNVRLEFNFNLSDMVVKSSSSSLSLIKSV